MNQPAKPVPYQFDLSYQLDKVKEAWNDLRQLQATEKRRKLIQYEVYKELRTRQLEPKGSFSFDEDSFELYCAKEALKNAMALLNRSTSVS